MIKYYRAHRKKDEFSADEAWSLPLHHGDEARGYSVFSSPGALHAYVLSGKYPDLTIDVKAGNREVLIFAGEEVGTGADGEPLVVPYVDEPDERISWEEFCQKLRLDSY